MVCFVGHESEECPLPSKELLLSPEPSNGGVIHRRPTAGRNVNPVSKGLGVCDLDLDPEPEVTVLDPEPPDLDVFVDNTEAAGDVECRLLVKPLPPCLGELDSNAGFSAIVAGPRIDPQGDPKGEFLPFVREVEEVELERAGIEEVDVG